LLSTLSGYTPWYYSKFLDYATERILLRRTGGNYIFMHRILQEHFITNKSGTNYVPEQHSPWSIAATTLGLLSVALMCFIIALIYVGDTDNPTVSIIGVITIVAGGLSNIMGLLSGLGSLFQRNRHKGFAIAGVVLNLIIFLSVCGFIALVFALSQSGG
jgi:hypothetical protein